MKYREAQHLLSRMMAERLERIAWKIRPKEPLPEVLYPQCYPRPYLEEQILVETQSEADALNKFQVNGRLDWRLGDTMIVRQYTPFIISDVFVKEEEQT